MDKLILSWQDVDRAIVEIANRVRKDFNPDVLVCIARGGCIPGVRLSHIFGDKPLEVIQVKYYKGYEHLKEPELMSEIKPFQGKVLLVDDVADTGASLKLVFDSLVDKCQEVRTAVVAYKPRSALKPDYFIIETDKWVVFPWEEFGR